jgi:hypothetical protein
MIYLKNTILCEVAHKMHMAELLSMSLELDSLGLNPGSSAY